MTLIAGYETAADLLGYRELITRGAIDIAQPDLVWSGEFTECREVVALAQAHNLPRSPHCFSSVLVFVAARHFAASSPNVLTVEWDQTEHGLRTELLSEPFDYDGAGMMPIPEGPGFGVTLNRDTLEKYHVC
jgi:L-alanine-DL-glutamate epimerase-like enolase superfamily enzyme